MTRNLIGAIVRRTRISPSRSSLDIRSCAAAGISLTSREQDRASADFGERASAERDLVIDADVSLRAKQPLQNATHDRPHSRSR